MKFAKYLLYLLYFIFFFVFLHLIIGFYSMDKGLGMIEHSDTLEEAKKENVLISKYLVYNKEYKLIDTAWSEFGRTQNIFGRAKIEKEKKLLQFRYKKISVEQPNLPYKAYYKNKKLTSFRDSGLISIIGVKEYMDTLFLENETDKYSYILIKEKQY